MKIDKDKLLFIADDKASKWFFDGERYIALNKKDEPVGHMLPWDIPDPIKLWQAKCHAAGVSLKSPVAEQYKSNPVVYKLYEHAKKVMGNR